MTLSHHILEAVTIPVLHLPNNYFFSSFFMCFQEENTEAFISLQIPPIPFPLVLSPHISYQPPFKQLVSPILSISYLCSLYFILPLIRLSCTRTFPLHPPLLLSVSLTHYQSSSVITLFPIVAVILQI